MTKEDMSMKKLAVVLLVLAVGIFGAISVASAEMYISGNVGAVWVNDADIDDGFDEGEIEFDTGFGINAALGSSYENGLRAEVELAYQKSDMDKISADGYGSASIDGDITAVALMVNAFYDFMPNEKFSPFIGAGIGYANLDADIDDFGSADDNVFAYQASAGVGVALNQELKLDLQYRFFGTEDPDFDGLDAEYTTHNMMVGLRYSF
jgi:opacity protein-like surface antigen